MPVIAVGVAIGASVAAGTAIATVGLTVVSALEVVAAVGATLGAIGAVTGNKTLSMVGTVIGAVGAIGGLAAGAGLLGEATASDAPLFGSAPTASTADQAAAGTVDFVAGDAAPSGLIDAPPAPPGGVGAVDPATGEVISQATSGVAAAPPTDTITLASTSENAADPAAKLGAAPTGAADATAPTGLPDTSAGGLINTAPPTAPAGTTDLIQPPPPPTANLGATDPATGQTITSAVDPATGKVIDMPDAAKGIFGNLMAFAGKNPVVALGALQAGGSMLSGLTSTLTPAQVSALNAQAAANDAAAALTRQQTTNLAAPKAVASSAPVTGAPAPLVPGMINRAPVTGVAA